MKLYRLLACGLLVLLVGCARTREVGPMPDDFQVAYHWSEGSLPPPYHYEYDIRLGPGPQGEIEFTPDYPDDDVPVWTESFPLDDETLEELYDLMAENGVFTQNWRQEEDTPDGGYADWMEVTARGEEIAIPSYVAGGRAEIQEVYDAITALVPQETWDTLYTQQAEYQQTHPDY